MGDGERKPVDLGTLRSWGFITHHARVLLALERDPQARVRDLAAVVELTERAVYRILADLQETGYVRREKYGRRNRYRVNPELPLRDPLVEDELVRDLLALLHEVEPRRV
jgi:DNA-binding IclR family transcriptional regulator